MYDFSMKSPEPIRWIAYIFLALSLTGCKIEVSTETAGTAGNTTATASQTSGGEGYTARVMSYNIQYFNTDATNHGNRIGKLQQILADINPDIVAVQEVEDRAAMELVFPPDQWQILIDDDSRDRQDVAIAVRSPWKITNAPVDLDADDAHFLAPGSANESFFPVRRDALFAKVATPDGRPAFTVICIHAKARVGGRANTDHRRVGASKKLVELFDSRLDGDNIVLMGDFNDSPDDVSLNILETGNPSANAGPNPWPSNYMVNLFQPLWEQGMVTEGASNRRLEKGTGLINNTYSDARSRNNRLRGRDAGTGPIMFDQILISKALAPGDSPVVGHIYRKPIALTGPGFSRPSDHLPVYADVQIP